MADIVLSPVPYGGGGIYTGAYSYSVVPINNTFTRWAYQFKQNNPFFMVLGLVEITPSIKDASPTINHIKQRAITYYTTSKTRLFRLQQQE